MSHLFIQSPAPEGVYPIKTREVRLSPGALFHPEIVATDAHINPVDLPPDSLQWQVEPPHLGTFSAEGVFRAQTPGRGRLVAFANSENGPVSTELPIHIIGEPVALEIEPLELSLSANQSVKISVRAVDALGYRAPLSGENLQWETHGNAGTFRDGHFHAGETAGAGSITARFGQLTVSAPVGVGAEPAIISAFDDLTRWTTNAVPEQASSKLTPIDHKPYIRNRSKAAKLAYDFTGTTRTRAAYVRPAGGPLILPGRPLRLGVWVFGDGREAWLRAQIADAINVARAIDFSRHIDWTGWRYLEAEIPPGTDYPISLRAIYVVETRPDTQYAGAVYFDELLAVNAPEIDPSLIPETPLAIDPDNRPAEIDPTRNDHFRFIVFGDSKVEAATPDSSGAKIFDALIEHINREQNIEFVLFTGDLIENDTDTNYRFGKQFLDRLAFPYHFAVANHEIAGTDNFDRYREFFGETYYGFEHANSEFLILNTARTDGLRASEVEQWPWLREKLANTTAQNLFLMTHTPVIDPMPGGKTGWTDPAEIELFQSLLTEVAELGKNVYLFHGHVHGFDRRIYDGVQYLTTAGAGSPLYLPPTKGGFFHYTIITVKGDEVTYQVIPLIERIELPETVELTIGQTTDLAPIAVAPENLVRFPLRYPAAVTWEVANPTLATIDPATATITAHAPCQTAATIRSGNRTATTQIKIR